MVIVLFLFVLFSALLLSASANQSLVISLYFIFVYSIVYLIYYINWIWSKACRAIEYRLLAIQPWKNLYRFSFWVAGRISVSKGNVWKKLSSAGEPTKSYDIMTRTVVNIFSFINFFFLFKDFLVGKKEFDYFCENTDFGPFSSLHNSLDSEYLASTSTDGAAKIWKTEDGVPWTFLSRNSVGLSLVQFMLIHSGILWILTISTLCFLCRMRKLNYVVFLRMEQSHFYFALYRKVHTICFVIHLWAI